MSFIDAQITYLQFKLAQAQRQQQQQQQAQQTGKVNNIRVNPSLFSFDGEFSVVADSTGGDMTVYIESVRRAVVEVVGSEFRYE